MIERLRRRPLVFWMIGGGIAVEALLCGRGLMALRLRMLHVVVVPRGLLRPRGVVMPRVIAWRRCVAELSVACHQCVGRLLAFSITIHAIVHAAGVAAMVAM